MAKPNAKPTVETLRRRGEKQHSELVFCLCIDLIDSTKVGLSRTTLENDRFNLAFVKQLDPRWASLVLEDTLIKFTGDGWLFMTNSVDQLPALCCLALIQAKSFQPEMSRLTGVSNAGIPALRIAICAGFDVSATLPDGSTDWVGDSARRAVRAAGYCGPQKRKLSQNEILVDETVRLKLQRDFNFGDAEMPKRVSAAKQSEEQLVLHTLIDLRLETCFESDARPHFIYTLGVTGSPEQVENVAERLIEKGAKEATDPQQRQKIIGDLNTLISSLPYPSALEIVARMRGQKLADLATDNILHKKKTNLG
jgi:hypothetical protein